MKPTRSFGVGGSGFAVLACLFVAVPSASLEVAPNMHHADVGVFTGYSNKETRSGECPHTGPEYKAWCGRPLTPKDGPHQLELSANLTEAKSTGSGICSQYRQDYVLASIFDKIGTTNRYFLEIGVRPPQNSNSAHFRLNCGWQGLILNGAPRTSPDIACPDCADAHALLNAPEDAPVRLRMINLTMDNVNFFFSHVRVPHSLDLLTIDINGNEYWILTALDMMKFQPRVVAIKFSSYFSKDQVLVPKFVEDRVVGPNEVNGASLAALDSLMKGRGYSYVAQVAGEHAIWVLRSALNKADQNGTQIPERVNEGWQVFFKFNATNYMEPAPQSITIDSLFSLAAVRERSSLRGAPPQ